ncbi:MAG: ATP-binding protein [Leptolyngbyaceae cyanobacterium RU_5_1]|nr:ATP-binding protein [Leptolyngbyaceae cyanobacterium RU_5_1]
MKTWLPYLVESFGIRVHECRQQLQVMIPDNLPLLITDLTQLERILNELLHNACKYTPAGGTISVGVKGVEDEGKMQNAKCKMQNSALLPTNQSQIQNPKSKIPSFLQISVTNTGVEIPANELSRIFDKFYRVPRNDPWKHGGTGLGLALVQRLVDCLRGTIHVVSENNRVEFIIQFPMLAGCEAHEA